MQLHGWGGAQHSSILILIAIPFFLPLSPLISSLYTQLLRLLGPREQRFRFRGARTQRDGKRGKREEKMKHKKGSATTAAAAAGKRGSKGNR